MNNQRNGGTPQRGMSPGKMSGALPLSIMACGLIAVVVATLVLAPFVASVAAKTVLPQVIGISPNEGPQAGGTSVTISGNYLAGATAVKFGSVAVAANNFQYNSEDNTITAVSPAGSGTVDVTVTTPAGTSRKSTLDQFTYVPAPVVNSINPSSGSTNGGASVTISGKNFTNVTAVSFGTVPAASFGYNFLNGTITAVSPGESAGKVDVIVTTQYGGASSPNPPDDQFTYVAAPTVTGVSPNEGPQAGGTSVDITGTNFTGVTVVNFGSVAAKKFTFKSSTDITATSPSESAGIVDVTVTTQYGGASATNSKDQFTYYSKPVVTGISPNEGPQAGGTTVTISGNYLAGATAVSFGTVPAESLQYNSSNGTITATSPKGSGTVDVTVTTPAGTSATNSNDQFTYVGAPTVSGLNPNSGPTNGGTSVTISGNNFTGVTGVKFGGVAASYSYSWGQLTAVSPAGNGTVDVTVTTQYGGTSATSSADKFSYYGPVVYSDSGYSVLWTQGVISTTAYVECFGLTPGTRYTLLYKDVNGTQVASDGFTATATTYKAELPLTGYKPDQAGLWTVILEITDGGSVSPDCNGGWNQAWTTFYVSIQDIPEFPAWFTGVLVLGLCAAAYIWMRKRHMKMA